MSAAHDVWLSGLLGKPAYHVHLGEKLLQGGDLPRGSFLDAKVPVADVATLSALQDLGFKVIDTNVQLTRKAARIDPPVAGVRFAMPGDESALRDLAAGSFVESRFYRDPRIGDDVASQVKREWAGNFFSGKRGEWMVVAEEDEKITGFLQLLRGNDDVVIIDLVAVAPDFRGRGLARSMIAFAAQQCLGRAADMLVGTQIANVGSLSLYDALNFRISSADYVLHLHTD
jgi:GNAT superfamily N-acetyltransferase